MEMTMRRKSNRGRILTTEPLKSAAQVRKVRAVIEDDPRSLALFTLGVNSALRSSDLLGLKRTDLKGNELFVRERKTGKLRRLLINDPTLKTIKAYLATRNDSHDWLFVGQRGKLTYGYLGSLVKRWFKEARIDVRNAAGHSLRKTFVRLNHQVHGVPLSTLMFALGHSSERQTMEYCGLLAEDVERVYKNVI
jgi:integrase